jgi:hypothetical protein
MLMKASCKGEEMQTDYTYTINDTTIEVRVSFACRNISISYRRGGILTGTSLMSFGAYSQIVPVSEYPNLQRAGIDPSTRRMFASRPVTILPAEIAAEIDKISDCAAAEEQRKTNDFAAQLAKIEGLDVLRAAIADNERYAHQLEGMMADEYNDGVMPPKAPANNIDTLMARYSTAAAYLLAAEWAEAANDAKASAGQAAVTSILEGQDPEQAIKTMRTEWSAFCERHIWD